MIESENLIDKTSGRLNNTISLYSSHERCLFISFKFFFYSMDSMTGSIHNLKTKRVRFKKKTKMIMEQWKLYVHLGINSNTTITTLTAIGKTQKQSIEFKKIEKHSNLNGIWKCINGKKDRQTAGAAS